MSQTSTQILTVDRSRFKPRRLRSVSHHITWFCGARIPRIIPLVFVTGFPKSGTTWACQLVADYLQLPFPKGAILPIGCSAVVHGHQLVNPRMKRCVYVMRDGRDVYTSLYFFASRRIPEGDNPSMSRHERAMFPGLVNKADIRTNLPRFLEAQMKRPFATTAHWGEHVRRFLESDNPTTVLLRYEDLKSNGAGALSQAMTELTREPADEELARMAVDKFSFSRQVARTGARTFLRGGKSGDWRNHFTPEAAQIFDDHCGRSLIESGYEMDRGWVESVTG